MTVHQETVGSRKDYGTVGYTRDKQGQVLLFPKSLAPFEGRKVLGVKYDLLEAPAAGPRRRTKSEKARKPAKVRKDARARRKKPRSKEFPELRVLPPPEEVRETEKRESAR